MNKSPTRRDFLLRSGAMGGVLGCSLAASPLLTPVSFASVPGDNRLVVIILRGGLDGLDVVRPWGDAAFGAARPDISGTREAGLALGDYWGLHPSLASLAPMWQAGELGFVHAVSTPYRDKRSHFDGQDLLEAGTANSQGADRDGWLNRLVGTMSGAHARTAFSIGDGEMLVTSGDAEIASWSPDVDVTMSAAGLGLLDHVMADDPVLARAMTQAIGLATLDGDQVAFEAADQSMVEAMDANVSGAARGKGHIKIAEFAANQLRADTRIATFSLGGWDTHRAQNRTLRRPLQYLAETITTLKQVSRPEVWSKTTVLAMTEFGRTVRQNGTGGTDHGTGGMMLAAGGAVRGGQVFGRWPGLDEAALYQRRDLMPTSDVRAWTAWVLRGSFGVSRAVLERDVFPGLDMGDDHGLLL